MHLFFSQGGRNASRSFWMKGWNHSFQGISLHSPQICLAIDVSRQRPWFLHTSELWILPSAGKRSSYPGTPLSICFPPPTTPGLQEHGVLCHTLSINSDFQTQGCPIALVAPWFYGYWAADLTLSLLTHRFGSIHFNIADLQGHFWY